LESDKNFLEQQIEDSKQTIENLEQTIKTNNEWKKSIKERVDKRFLEAQQKMQNNNELAMKNLRRDYENQLAEAKKKKIVPMKDQQIQCESKIVDSIQTQTDGLEEEDPDENDDEGDEKNLSCPNLNAIQEKEDEFCDCYVEIMCLDYFIKNQKDI